MKDFSLSLGKRLIISISLLFQINMSENSNNLELIIVIDGQSIRDLEFLSNWKNLVIIEIKNILEKNNYQITQSKRKKYFS